MEAFSGRHFAVFLQLHQLGIALFHGRINIMCIGHHNRSNITDSFFLLLLPAAKYFSTSIFLQADLLQKLTKIKLQYTFFATIPLHEKWRQMAWFSSLHHAFHYSL
jgi:hypothetical protein